MGATFAFLWSLGTSPDLSDFTEIIDVFLCKGTGQLTAPSGAVHLVPLAHGLSCLQLPLLHAYPLLIFSLLVSPSAEVWQDWLEQIAAMSVLSFSAFCACCHTKTPILLNNDPKYSLPGLLGSITDCSLSASSQI